MSQLFALRTFTFLSILAFAGFADAFVSSLRAEGDANVQVNARMGVDITTLLPDSDFDPGIKSPSDFFGFKLGSRHLRHHQLVDYARYLARTSDRVSLLPYGRTHGLRPLLVLMITSDAKSLQLDEVFKDRQRLASGRAKTDSLDDQKVVGYFGYCVHGDEASAANAFPAVAYYLAAARDKTLDELLDKSVLLVDPALNPDGVDRFANWVNENRGRFANPSGIDREHRQPWPGGRTNYYWFDLNRDWLPTVHPESQGRIKLLHQWKPNLVLDFHEMGSTSSYFFQPGIPERNNPLTPNRVFELTRQFAKEHAAALDSADELYFSEERFDDFYVGKGSTYPDLHGAIGILFEQGSTRGLRSKNDRYDRTFAETVANQVRTSLSSLSMLGKLRMEMLQHQAAFYRESLELASQSPTRAYILHAGGDRSRVLEAAKMIRRHDITVWIPDQEINVNGTRFASGTVAVIPTDQPEYRFLKSLMQRTQTFRENIFYDVSAWTTPLAFDLDVLEFTSELPEEWKSKSRHSSRVDSPDAREAIGYSIDPVSLHAPALVGKLLRNGIQVRVAFDPFEATISGEQVKFKRGSWIVLKAVNLMKWNAAEAMLKTASEEGTVQIQALERGLTPGGPDLGSNSHQVVPKPDVCLVVGEATSSLDAGSIWHTFDTRFGFPATLVDGKDLADADLRAYSCIVLPSGSYRGLDSDTVDQLQRYVRSGGTVVAVGAAIRWLKQEGVIDNPVGVSSARKQVLEHEHGAGDVTFAGAADRAALERIAGAFFSTDVDQTHPLAFGFPDRSVPVFRTSTTAHPLPGNALGVAASYTGTLAGYVSEANREKLMGTAAVWAENVGRGRVICIADSPTFRGYVRSTERFLSNAVLIGPVLTIPSDGNEEEDASDGHGHHHH